MGRTLVTGGASGIGAATCEALAAGGHDVVAADLVEADGVLALDVAIREGRAKPGDLVVLVGSGVGLNQAAVAVRLTDALVTRAA